jgi:hypothetical protein
MIQMGTPTLRLSEKQYWREMPVGGILGGMQLEFPKENLKAR